MVADGVETGEQLARLRELGFERAQGRYFAVSLPSDEVSALLSAGKDYTEARALCGVVSSMASVPFREPSPPKKALGSRGNRTLTVQSG